MDLSKAPMYFPVDPGFPAPTRQNTLRLIIQRTYFDQILAGKKSEEYREIKASKASSYLRLKPDPSTGKVPLHPRFPAKASPSIDYPGAIFPYLPRMYDYVQLVNGYASDAPVLVVKLKAIEIAQSGADEAPWIMIYHIDKVVRHNGEDLISEETFSINRHEILPPKIIDNKREKVVDEMKLFLTKGSKMSVISAFFSIYAYAALRKELSGLGDFRLIFTEPTYIEKEKEAREFVIRKQIHEPDSESDEDWGALAGTSFEIRLRNEMKQAAIAKECARWIKEHNVHFRSLRQANPAQPRLINISGSRGEMMINGTPDFTTDGLGITPSSRLDANTALYGLHSEPYLQMFDQLWDNEQTVKDVTEVILREMQVLYKENPPEFIYFLTLYHVFYNYLDELTDESLLKTKTGFRDTDIWSKLYKFQQDGAVGAIDKLEKYNGCIIADSVGLGKTFTALAVIKYYELRNYRVLVLCPKKLRDNWTIHKLNDRRNLLARDRFAYDVLNHTDLSRLSGKSGDIDLALINWSNYDLVVIDESHNFRNNNPVPGRQTRYERLMEEIIRAGVKTKVLMLSATPVNNGMTDLKNQIAFITEGYNTALSAVGIRNIDSVLRQAQEIFSNWQDLNEEERTTDRFVEMMDLSYFRLLDTLTIARSRRHIEKYYDTTEIGRFPDKLTPINYYSAIDSRGDFPPIEEIDKRIRKLQLPIYTPLSYVLPAFQDDYARKYDRMVGRGDSIFRQSDREKNLTRLLRVNLLKRMESSIHAFHLTLEKIYDRTEAALQALQENEYFTSDAFDPDSYDMDEADFDGATTDGAIQVELRHMDLLRYKEDLLIDQAILKALIKACEPIRPERDAKLQDLRTLIEQKHKQPLNPGNKKVIIFTAFADTAHYLYDALHKPLREMGLHTAVVVGSNQNRATIEIPQKFRGQIRLSDTSALLTLFSPISKEANTSFPDFSERIDVLIGTDCISEGQNLQDCDFLVNYDIHWNPVRIIQRFGRIDRIGSCNERIQLVNFWPTKDLDTYINLQQRVRGRMVLLNVSATGEENPLDANEGKEMKDLLYRRKQLERLQTEVVNLEDISGGISITDLTLNDFKADLSAYLKAGHRRELDKAPYGLYAIARIPDTLRSQCPPGVLFTLRQIRGETQSKETNPLYPLYLLYIDTAGQVVLSEAQAKKIFDLYKSACKGEIEPIASFTEAFDRETDGGTKMDHYSALLESCITHIRGSKERAGIQSLFSRGGTSVDKNRIFGLEDYELVSFLILQ